MVTACGLIFTCYGNSKQDVVDLADGIVEFLSANQFYAIDISGKS